MNFKKLAIAFAVVFTFSLSSIAPVAQLAPVQQAMAQAAPAPAEQKAAGAAADAVPTQYSLGHIWTDGSWISKAILVVLAIMSAGTWYIFFTKWLDQQRVLGQAAQVEKKFWSSATLNEGVDKLPKNSVFRGIAEAGPVWASITVPDADPFLAPLIYAIPVQLLAYYAAVAKGTDVDQPRNLAKSVTVE